MRDFQRLQWMASTLAAYAKNIHWLSPLVPTNAHRRVVDHCRVGPQAHGQAPWFAWNDRDDGQSERQFWIGTRRAHSEFCFKDDKAMFRVARQSG